jgi:hypothetical protein
MSTILTIILPFHLDFVCESYFYLVTLVLPFTRQTKGYRKDGRILLQPSIDL